MADLTNVELTVNIDFTAHIDGDKNKELIKYQATVVFSSITELLKAGGESVTRKLQTQARSKNGFPTGRRVTVDENGKYAPTPEEKAAATFKAIEEMEDEAQLEKLFQLYQAKKAAKAQQQA